jgi:amino acid transporter
MTFEHGADVAGPSTTGDDKSVYKTNSEEVFVSGSGDHDAVYGVGGVGNTHRRLKARHVTFIGFGGGIGTGLFVGTGSALASAGPLGLLLAYSVVGMILWCVMESIGEIATLVSENVFKDNMVDC